MKFLVGLSLLLCNCFGAEALEDALENYNDFFVMSTNGENKQNLRVTKDFADPLVESVINSNERSVDNVFYYTEPWECDWLVYTALVLHANGGTNLKCIYIEQRDDGLPEFFDNE